MTKRIKLDNLKDEKCPKCSEDLKWSLMRAMPRMNKYIYCDDCSFRITYKQTNDFLGYFIDQKVYNNS